MRPLASVVSCVLLLSACQQETPPPSTLVPSPPAPPPVAEAPLQPPPAPQAAAPVEKAKAAAEMAPKRLSKQVARGDVLGASGLGGGGLGGLGLRGSGTGGGGSGLGLVGAGKGSRAAVAGSLGGPGSGLGLGGVGLVRDDSSGESHGEYRVNDWTQTDRDHLSTFSIDVDTASYTLARAKLLLGQLPPRDSVRVEEWLNYFRYTTAPPPPGAPLGVELAAAPSPFSPGKHLLKVSLQGKKLDVSERKPAHLTFLVDVSGSMQPPERLPLAKRALRMLVDQLREEDTVALVTYAGATRLVLPHTGMDRKAQIHAAIEDLTAGGSTAMASGLQLAYAQAVKALDRRSTSRVIVLSDGDANVGPATHQEHLALVKGHVADGVTLTTVGFGMGNYKAELMEQLADKGNGNHFYVDSLMAARRIFVEQLGGTLEVIAKDVKLQVDFDPAQVKAYRLVGYENRDLADRDFREDKVDAGELGSGHTVTALYELELKAGAGAGLCTVRVRAKPPRGTVAAEQAYPFPKGALVERFAAASADLRFATAVMGAAELFRRSAHARTWDYDLVQRIAAEATPPGNAERQEFLALLKRARDLGRTVARAD